MVKSFCRGLIQERGEKENAWGQLIISQNHYRLLFRQTGNHPSCLPSSWPWTPIFCLIFSVGRQTYPWSDLHSDKRVKTHTTHIQHTHLHCILIWQFYSLLALPFIWKQEVDLKPLAEVPVMDYSVWGYLPTSVSSQGASVLRVREQDKSLTLCIIMGLNTD